jgi:hypothetical protein
MCDGPWPSGLVISLGGCAVATTPDVKPTTSATSSPQNATNTKAASSAMSSSPYDTLPTGYTYAYLRVLKQVAGRWSAVLDPLTMCSEGAASKDPNCAGATYSDNYAILNLSTKTYTVPLAQGASLRIIGPSGGPEDYVDLTLAEKSWGDGMMTVNYQTNAAVEVTSIKEFWHP